MNRTNIYLSDGQRAELDARARAEGISRAELVRRILDRALQGGSDDLDSDLAAIDGSFGALSDVDLTVERGDGARGDHLERIASR
ncbi:CopG family transcriptional regulator [Pseudonocardia sediminis]|nr:CopG family transcriptional regulator [Pseudonocardia sediminis]